MSHPTSLPVCGADAKNHWGIHRDAPPFVEQSTSQEILVTGIKVHLSLHPKYRASAQGLHALMVPQALWSLKHALGADCTDIDLPLICSMASTAGDVFVLIMVHNDDFGVHICNAVAFLVTQQISLCSFTSASNASMPYGGCGLWIPSQPWACLHTTGG